MGSPLPPEVSSLLHADRAGVREAAWERFAANHSRLILHTVRTVIREQDRVMDAYAWILERLHEDGARRLRSYNPDGPGRFTTWLVVVARRLSVDFLRHQGGRTRDPEGRGTATAGWDFRRRLLVLAGDPVELDRIPGRDAGPDAQLELNERHRLVSEVVGELDPLDRLLLALRFDDGLEAEQIARAMHLPTRFHVYRRLNRVLDDLKHRLNGRGIHDAS